MNEMGMMGALALAVVVVWFVRHQRSLKRRAETMQEAIRNRDFMFRLPTDGLLSGERAMQETLNLLGSTIRQQVNRSEVESWERLTRVLTHEIMNATAPIASISQSMLARDDVKGTPLEEGVHAIHATAVHLNNFVDSYRKLSQWQPPALEDVDLRGLLADLQQLFPAISWQINLPSDGTGGGSACIVHTDPNLLRQVLVNLAKNAVEAGAKGIGIRVTGASPHKDKGLGGGPGLCQLDFSNDGAPIPAEVRHSIFVPFFTTKRTGTGIGLSLSRRMMIQQGGGMELADCPVSPFHTTFQLWFPDNTP